MSPATVVGVDDDAPKRHARFPFTCVVCQERGDPGEPIGWRRNAGEKSVVWHWRCRAAAPRVLATRPVLPHATHTVDEPCPLETDTAHAVARLDAPTPGTLEGLIAAAVAPLLDGKVKAGLDADAVNALVDAKLAGLTVPRTLVVEHADTGERVDLGLVHEAFADLLALVKVRHHVYQYGPPGTGESTAASQVATALGLSFAHLSLNPQTPESRLLGFIDAGGTYRTTPFRLAYETGGVFSIEEADNMHPALANTLNTLLENGHGAFPTGMVPRHPDFVLVANGNTAAFGGDLHFPERRAFDSAFRERFTFLAWPIDETLESACVDAVGAGRDGRRWLDWLRDVRRYASTHAPRLVVSPRAGIKGAALLVATTWPASVIAERVLWKGSLAAQGVTLQER